jgi:hypothetical protein
MYTHNRESVATRRTAPIVAFSLRTADERFVASWVGVAWEDGNGGDIQGRVLPREVHNRGEGVIIKTKLMDRTGISSGG